MDARRIGSEIIVSRKFLRLENVRYQDSLGNLHDWEAVQRNGNNRAAAIFATLQPSGRLIAIRQFRPPVGAYCIEVPAGLVDPGEDAMVTAVRELKEETGYTGTVSWISEAGASSAGLTGEMIQLVWMDVDETLPENQSPKANLQDAEEIEVMLLAPEEIGPCFRKAIQRGDVISSRFMVWAASRGIRW